MQVIRARHQHTTSHQCINHRVYVTDNAGSLEYIVLLFKEWVERLLQGMELLIGSYFHKLVFNYTQSL